MADNALLVFSTFPDVATARRIGRELVEQRCAACANILPQIESIYWWVKKVENATETPVLFKTSAERYQALESTLRRLHPYDVPEIIALPVTAGLPAYLSWVTENCTL
jgi:periplasmic divalent cation tolerance protein